MKNRILLVAGAVLISSVAGAQSPWSLSVAGGAAVPTGRFADAAELGWHGLASIGLSSLMQPISLRLDVAYAQFDGALLPDEVITSATLNAAYRLPMTNSPLSPYLITGAGAYRFDCLGGGNCDASTRFGWNAGLGTKFATMGLKGFLEARFHAVNVDGGNIRYVPVTIGFTL